MHVEDWHACVAPAYMEKCEILTMLCSTNSHKIHYGIIYMVLPHIGLGEYVAMCRPHVVLTGGAEDGHTTVVYLYVSCVGAKNTTQRLLRDVSQCFNECHCPQKRYGGMGCAVVQQAIS